MSDHKVGTFPTIASYVIRMFREDISVQIFITNLVNAIIQIDLIYCFKVNIYVYALIYLISKKKKQRFRQVTANITANKISTEKSFLSGYIDKSHMYT